MHPSLTPFLRLSIAALALWVAGCASTSDKGIVRDGAPDRPPADLAQQPNPIPKVEPIVQGGPNKPYVVQGQTYQPLTADVAWREAGKASWYARKFHGRRTASGEVYSMFGLTGAHRTLPIPSYAKVRHLKSGKSVIIRINDRGPFHPDRVVDLSYAAAAKLGIVNAGVAEVEVTRLTAADIQAGAWDDGDEPSDGVEVAQVKDAGSQSAASVAAAKTPSSKAHTPNQRGFYVQLGAFKDRDGVERLQRRVGAELVGLMPLLAVFHETSLFKLKVGPYASRGEAQHAASQAREALKLSPLVVQRR